MLPGGKRLPQSLPNRAVLFKHSATSVCWRGGVEEELERSPSQQSAPVCREGVSRKAFFPTVWLCPREQGPWPTRQMQLHLRRLGWGGGCTVRRGDLGDLNHQEHHPSRGQSVASWLEASGVPHHGASLCGGSSNTPCCLFPSFTRNTKGFVFIFFSFKAPIKK